MDVFYKLKALSSEGIKISLHAFAYGREVQPELESLCEKVYVYKRRTGFRSQLSSLPYIVQSRNLKQLLENLANQPGPILFEGQHCTAFLNHPALANRIKLVRAHNVEHEYYRGLFHQEKKWPRKLFFLAESIKLKNHEKKLYSHPILAISPSDYNYFSTNAKETHFLPLFIPANEPRCKPGLGKYALYHGDLSVNENVEAARFLITKTWKGLSIPLVLAGKDPRPVVRRLSHQNPLVKLVENPSATEMDQLIQDAQVIVLPTFQPTGMKLKLLNSLFAGRHCVANDKMIQDTGLEPLCHLANTPREIRSALEKLFKAPFTEQEINKRKEILLNAYSNKKNARTFINLLTEKKNKTS
jgi:glycosyltransferase involved in cell wall biosynthesis